MVKWIDRLFCALLLVGAALHGAGSFAAYPAGSEVLVWSLAASLAAALLAMLNFMRTARRDDWTLALVCAAGCICWLAVSMDFGTAIGHYGDLRVLWHAVCALALAVFSVRTMLTRY